MSEEKQKRPFYKKWWVWVIAIFVIAIIGSIGNDDGQTTNAPPGNKTGQQPEAVQTIKISATALFSEYKANEVAADEKYKNKTLEVNGIIYSIGKDITDSMYVALKTDDVIGTVQCMFPKEATQELSSLSKDQTITIRGKCDGKFGNIILRESVIAK